jgi:hypothetical protein
MVGELDAYREQVWIRSRFAVDDHLAESGVPCGQLEGHHLNEPSGAADDEVGAHP